MAKSFKEIAKLAREHQLFIKGWSMEILYDIIMTDFDNSSGLKIALHYENKVPVACVVLDVSEHFISIFVKPEFRSRGIGKTLVNKILKRYKKTPDKIVSGEGEKNSMEFFKSLGIFCVEYDNILLEQEFSEQEKALLLKKTIAEIMQMRIDKEKKELKTLESLDKMKLLKVLDWVGVPVPVADLPSNTSIPFEDI